MLCASCGHDHDPMSQDAPCARCGGPTLLDGRYRLDAAIGAGAHGMTYRATRLVDAQAVAIKELTYRSLDTLKTHELFEREASVLKRLDHPNIPRCFEYFLWGIGKHQALYLVEQLIEGETLAQELEKRTYDELSVLEVVISLLNILVYLHSRTPPVIHRDIKLDNVMRGVDGALYLVDFGAVQDMGERTSGSTMIGSFGYMAPELFIGRSLPASDIYAVGALACALLTRRAPHTLVEGQELGARLPERLRLRPGVRALLSAMLDTSPERRPDAASALAEASALASGEPRGGALASARATTAPARVAQTESLFGLSAALVLVPLAAAPCLALFFGILPTMSVAAGLAALVVLAVPFMHNDEGG